MSTVSIKDEYRTTMNEDVYCNEDETGCYTNRYVRWLEHQAKNNEVLDLVMLSDDDDVVDDCPCFDKCKNPLKDKNCDDNMNGSQYCFKE